MGAQSFMQSYQTIFCEVVKETSINTKTLAHVLRTALSKRPIERTQRVIVCISRFVTYFQHTIRIYIYINTHIHIHTYTHTHIYTVQSRYTHSKIHEHTHTFNSYYMAQYSVDVAVCCNMLQCTVMFWTTEVVSEIVDSQNIESNLKLVSRFRLYSLRVYLVSAARGSNSQMI